MAITQRQGEALIASGQQGQPSTARTTRPIQTGWSGKDQGQPDPMSVANQIAQSYVSKMNQQSDPTQSPNLCPSCGQAMSGGDVGAAEGAGAGGGASGI